MYLRGDVAYCNLGEENIVGSEQKGLRPVLIIQNNTGNKYSPTVVVASITSRINKTKLPTHVDLYNYPNLQPQCTVLLEQIRTVDKRRLSSRIASISPEDMHRIDKAILISTGINATKLMTEV